jgi:hypothetical protein
MTASNRTTAAKNIQNTNGPRQLSHIEATSKELTPLVQPDYRGGQTPFYSTGARAFIRIGGQAIGVAQSISWKVSYNGTMINTIDSIEAWDIDVGRLSVTASLAQIIDPTKGPETDAMFAVMRAAVHQPMVEMQVLDALGTTIFFARGMFLSISGNVARGQLSGINAEFTGTMYQHYSSQAFQPYGSVAGTASKLAGSLKKLASNLTGGVL